MALVLPSMLPFAPGESPFTTKGSVYKGILERIDVDVEGGCQAVFDRCDDPALVRFFRQRFLASSWYDYLPLLLLARARLALRPPSRSDVEVVVADAIRHAEADIAGIYRFALRFVSPEAFMRRAPIIHRQYLGFGRSEVNSIESGACVTTFHGFPLMGASFFRVYSWPFTHRLLTLAGAKTAAIDHAPLEPDGVLRGVPLVRIRARVIWS